MRVDDFGTMTGRRPGTEPGPAVLLGSHLDTVVRGGRYDGALGVLGALEVVRTLNDAGIVTRLPIEVVNWTDEEGARFEPANMASGTWRGASSRDFVTTGVIETAGGSRTSCGGLAIWARIAAARGQRLPISSCMSNRGPCSKMRAWRSGWSRASSASPGRR